MISVIIPASNEAAHIGRCIGAVLAQDLDPRAKGGGEIIVVANGCLDDTADRARAVAAEAGRLGWVLDVIEVSAPGKSNALNLGDARATGEIRIYLDADVVLGASMLREICLALARPEPAYASGQLVVAPARSWWTRRYAALWARVPFMRSGVPGAGLFAVNAAGRARWGTFPAIISDDTFARLQFRPVERIGVPASYTWPMVEGLAALVRVRRRQDAGVAEIRALYPHLMANDGTPRLGAVGLLRLFASQPVDFLVYAGVAAAVRLGGRAPGRDWGRGPR